MKADVSNGVRMEVRVIKVRGIYDISQKIIWNTEHQRITHSEMRNMHKESKPGQF